MGEADFAGPGHARAAADHAGVRDGVVRRAEGAGPEESAARLEGAGDAVDAGGFDGFLEGEAGKDAGEPFREHGFAGTRRANHDDVVTAGGRDEECAPRAGLAAD